MRGNIGNGLTEKERQEIGHRIDKIKGDMSLTEFGKILGVHPSMIGNWTNGVAMPTLGNLIRLCRETGRTSDEILGVSNVIS